jgi:hypothetical protein
MNKISVYHLCGHNDIWNCSSLENDKVGHGLILSPTNKTESKIYAIKKVTKEKSFFDPQFYLPRSQHKSLNSFSFFPNNISGGYQTIEYEKVASESARLCVEFQVNNGFQYIVIPTLFYDEFPVNYIHQLKELYTIPFLNAISINNKKKPILLSIIVKDSQLELGELRDNLLNYLTSYQEIEGVFLIPYYKSTSKRIKNIDYLYNLMTFIDILKANDLKVHLAYTDIEAYILSLANIDSVTLGSYENLRNFHSCISSERFEKHEEKKKMSPPTPRIYSSKLFQWIDYRYIKSIEAVYPQSSELFRNTPYKVTMFQPEYNWHFTKPELYKHYFMSFSEQINNLPDIFDLRYTHIIKSIMDAINCYHEISEAGVLLDENSDGSHLQYWATALNRYYKYKRG